MRKRGFVRSHFYEKVFADSVVVFAAAEVSQFRSYRQRFLPTVPRRRCNTSFWGTIVITVIITLSAVINLLSAAQAMLFGYDSFDIRNYMSYLDLYTK
jgi:ABC-type transport system involved in cytochrome bd biosynthesis fused ATPase/permease subunit